MIKLIYNDDNHRHMDHHNIMHVTIVSLQANAVLQARHFMPPLARSLQGRPGDVKCLACGTTV